MLRIMFTHSSLERMLSHFSSECTFISWTNYHEWHKIILYEYCFKIHGLDFFFKKSMGLDSNKLGFKFYLCYFLVGCPLGKLLASLSLIFLSKAGTKMK